MVLLGDLGEVLGLRAVQLQCKVNSRSTYERETETRALILTFMCSRPALPNICITSVGVVELIFEKETKCAL